MRKYRAWKVKTDSYKKKNDALFKEVLELKMYISSIKSNNEKYTLVGDEKTEENSATLDDPLKSNQPSPKSKPIKPKVLLISTSIRKKVNPELLSSLSKLKKKPKKLAYTKKTILNY